MRASDGRAAERGGFAGQPERFEQMCGSIADCCENLASGSVADAAGVFAKGDIPHIVQAVFDLPVRLCQWVCASASNWTASACLRHRLVMPYTTCVLVPRLACVLVPRLV